MNNVFRNGLVSLVVIAFGALAACDDDSGSTATTADNGTSPTTPADVALAEVELTSAGALALPEEGEAYNPEGLIPPQCYTRTEGRFNPCYTCHQTYPYEEMRPNQMTDGFLQGKYNFSDVGMTNHYLNLFIDRTADVERIPDQAILDYIAEDNYARLDASLDALGWEGWRTRLTGLGEGAAAFDEQGFALDGSGWVAFNYKPLPSTFWPTNGSTDDVMVRLPVKFRTASCLDGTPRESRDTYLANLAIMEAAVKDLASISVPPIDENAFCEDLNGDGAFTVITRIRKPQTYVGDAADVEVARMLYPEGVEFLHSVRYVGVDEAGDTVIPPRMKELRYMRKHRFYNRAELASKYGNEKQEKIDGNLARFKAMDEGGLNNGFGWQVLGFIEDADGDLRPQTREEHLYCMGCHTTLGATIDQTFAFPRKMTGAEGWGYIDLRGMSDAPAVGETDGEILQYLRRVGGGSEFRENDEMRARWFEADGGVDADKVRAADVYELITPSRERALALNKAYWTIVHHQTYIYGRDATIEPAGNVYEQVPEDVVPLPDAYQHWGEAAWEMRLDW